MAQKQALSVAEKLEAVPSGDYISFLQSINRDDLAAELIEIGEPPLEDERILKLLFDGIVQHVCERAHKSVTNISVQDVLQSKVPEYNTLDEREGTNSKNWKWPRVLPTHVEEMDECTYDTIKTAFGFTFDMETSECRSNMKRRATDVEHYLKPKVEAEIQHVAQSYMLPIIQACVNAGLESLPEELGIPEDTTLVMKGIEGFMEQSDSSLDESQYVRAKARGIMDWSIYLLIKGKEKRYIAVGENKLSSKWTSSWLPRKLGGKFAGGEAQWPLRQKANYCLNSNTSWSFLYTPKETVLCRFYIVKLDEGKKNTSDVPCFGMQWKSIPTQPDMPHNPLGSVMGIWAWVLFSFVDEDRGLRTRDELCPLADILPKFGFDPAEMKQMKDRELSSEVFERVIEGVCATMMESCAVDFFSAIRQLRDLGKNSELDEISGYAMRGVVMIRDALKRKVTDDIDDVVDHVELPTRKRVWKGRLRSNKGNAVIGMGLP